MPSGGSYLHRINSNTRRVVTLEGLAPQASGVTYIRQKSDFGTFTANLATLTAGRYEMLAAVDLVGDTLEGDGVIITGDGTAATALTTDSTVAMIASATTGDIELRNIELSNDGGPMLAAAGDLILDHVGFNGDPNEDDSGLGTVGTAVSPSKVDIRHCVLRGLTTGLVMSGTVGTVAIHDNDMESMNTASAYKAVGVATGATVAEATISNNRFATDNSADRILNLNTGATYTTPVQAFDNSIQGTGTFMEAGGEQKTGVNLNTRGNLGASAPNDSKYGCLITLAQGNVEDTIIATVSVPVRLGAGNGSHPLMALGPGAEGFTISGATTVAQVIKYVGDRTRTFRVSTTANMLRVGTGDDDLQIAVLTGAPASAAEVTASLAQCQSGDLGVGQVQSECVITMDKDDEMYFQVSNETDGDDLEVQLLNCTIIEDK